MRCEIWYHLYNLENVKNTHGGVLILVKLQAEAIVQMVPNRATHHILRKGSNNAPKDTTKEIADNLILLKTSKQVAFPDLTVAISKPTKRIANRKIALMIRSLNYDIDETDCKDNEKVI